jgi:hypothetical protein
MPTDDAEAAQRALDTVRDRKRRAAMGPLPILAIVSVRSTSHLKPAKLSSRHRLHLGQLSTSMARRAGLLNVQSNRQARQAIHPLLLFSSKHGRIGQALQNAPLKRRLTVFCPRFLEQSLLARAARQFIPMAAPPLANVSSRAHVSPPRRDVDDCVDADDRSGARWQRRWPRRVRLVRTPLRAESALTVSDLVRPCGEGGAALLAGPWNGTLVGHRSYPFGEPRSVQPLPGHSCVNYTASYRVRAA